MGGWSDTHVQSPPGDINANNGTWGNDSGWNHSAVKCAACSQEGHDEACCPNQHRTDNMEGAHDGMKCFSCGESGHRAAECPTPVSMACNYCKKEGHMIRDCPNKPPMVCDNCGEDGHLRKNCQNARVVKRDHIADVSPDDALAKIKTAASERDIDDAKEGVQEYVKAVGGDVNYQQLQNMFIDNDINLWLIATERQLVSVFTNMDLQGKTGKKYTVSYRFSENPERPKEAEAWPKGREEILNRLQDAGEVVDSGMSLCHRCGELGHTTKFCTQEPAQTSVQPAITCNNCGAEGHRIRDCPEPRVDKFACRNCGKSGHRAAECEEPSQDGGGSRGCRNCGQEGHIAKECDQPRNMDTVTCRNCEKTGHFSRDCPEPKDWSKVQCSNCQQFGHTKMRCKEAPVEDNGFGDAEQNAAGVDNSWPTGDDSTGGANVVKASGW